MYQMTTIQSIHTSDSITLFWEKPEDGVNGCIYEISIDGKKHGVTDKTHYTLEGLSSNCEYQIQVARYRKETVIAVSELLVLYTEPEKERIDITKDPYLAVGDGKTLNTQAIQRAIDACGKEQMVYIPKGIFMSGALRLHSDMELYLEQGAVLQGTDCIEDYSPRIKSRFEGLEMECYSSLLNLGELDRASGYNCQNVVIRGKGTIASGGRPLAEKIIASERERLKEELEALGDSIAEYENADTIPGRVRPRLINMSNSQNVILAGLELKNGASWNVHMIYSDQIFTYHCNFYSQGVWNGDGWDPDSSTNCTIFDCTFHTGDDSIAIKAGKNPEGNVIQRPCEHIRIFDCRCAFGHGFAIGSEMSGGVNDISIWDCDLSNSAYGIELKGTRKRGGYIRNVRVKDCVVPRIMFHSVGYNDDGEGALCPPVFEKCEFERMLIRGKYNDREKEGIPCVAIELCGFEEPEHHIRDIVFRDVILQENGLPEGQRISMRYCRNITFENVNCNS